MERFHGQDSDVTYFLTSRVQSKYVPPYGEHRLSMYVHTCTYAHTEYIIVTQNSLISKLCHK